MDTSHHADHEEELILFTAHTNLLILYAKALAMMACGGVLFLAWVWTWTLAMLSGTGHGHGLLIVLALVGICGGAWVMLAARGRVQVVTVANRGLIRQGQDSFLKTRRQITLFRAIHDVAWEQSWLGALLDYGQLEIILDGGRTLTFRNIRGVRRLAEEIEAHQQHEHRQPRLGACEAI